MSIARYEINGGVVAQPQLAEVTVAKSNIEEKLLAQLRRSGLMAGLYYDNINEKMELTLVGTLTGRAGPRLKVLASGLFDAGYCRVSLDLRTVRQIDGPGLAALVWMTAQAKDRNGYVTLVGLSPQVCRMVLTAQAHFLLNIVQYDLIAG